jgi:hypothetical protein
MRRFFGLLCAHKWEMVARYSMVGHVSTDWVGVIVELRCEHCGDVRWRKSR